MTLKNARSVIFESFLFKGIDDLTKEQILDDCRIEIKDYRKGDRVYDSKSALNFVGFVLSGGIKIYNGKGNKKTLLNEKKKGDIFGAALMFSDEQKPVSLIFTNGATSLAYIPEDDFLNMILSDKRITLNYINFLTERIRFLNKKISDFTLDGNENKVSRYLCEQCDEFGVIQGFNCQKTANKLNMSRASLYRILNSFESEGVIEKGTGFVKIINKERLQ